MTFKLYINFIFECTCTFTASQMWCLARFLPLMIGDLIPFEDEYWENFLTLLDIMDYVFVPSTTPEKVSHIAVLVEDFLTEFSHLYNQPELHVFSTTGQGWVYIYDPKSNLAQVGVGTCSYCLLVSV